MPQAQRVADHFPRLEGHVPAWEQASPPEQGRTAKSHAREVENLKLIIDEITVANDILKKNLGRSKAMRMQAVHEVSRGMSLNKALRYCGASKQAGRHVDEGDTDRVCPDPHSARAKLVRHESIHQDWTKEGQRKGHSGRGRQDAARRLPDPQGEKKIP